MTNRHIKDVQHHSASGKYKAKPQGETTSHQSEWLKLTSQEMTDVGEDVEKGGTLLHHWWECKLIQPLWKTARRFLKKLKIELPYDPATALLGIYPKIQM